MLFGLSVVIKQNSLQSVFTNNVCCVDHNKERTEGDNKTEVICLEMESTALSNTDYTLKDSMIGKILVFKTQIFFLDFASSS